MKPRILIGIAIGAAVYFTAGTAWPQGVFGADALANYQQLLDYDFDAVNPPAGLAAVRVNNPADPDHNFAHAKGHAEKGGPTRVQAAVQGFEPALPPPGPGEFTGLTSAGSVWNATTWTPTTDLQPPPTEILVEVTFRITGRMATGYLSDDTNTPDEVEGIVPNPMDINSAIDISLSHTATLFQTSATLDAVNGLTADGPWSPDFVTAILAGIETRAHWVDSTLVSTPFLAEVGTPIDIEVFMMATAYGILPRGVVASADFWGTSTYSLRALDATTQAPLPGVTFIPDTGASPTVRLTAIHPETNHQVRLTWAGPTNDIRILHSPTIRFADWNVVAWPDPGDTWAVPASSNNAGCYLIRVGDP